MPTTRTSAIRRRFSGTVRIDSQRATADTAPRVHLSLQPKERSSSGVNIVFSDDGRSFTLTGVTPGIYTLNVGAPSYSVKSILLGGREIREIAHGELTVNAKQQPMEIVLSDRVTQDRDMQVCIIVIVDEKSMITAIDTQTLIEERKIVDAILSDEYKALKVVATALDQLPGTLTSQIKKRPDNTGEEYHPSRPLIGPRALLRCLVLDELDGWERDEERAGRLLTYPQQLTCFIKQIVQTVLHHTSFYAAVAITQILCDYPARQTIDMYTAVNPNREKPVSACTAAKKRFFVKLEERFGDRIQYEQGPGSWESIRLASKKPDPDEISLVRRYLRSFLPHLSEVPSNSSLTERVRGLFNESRSEMEMIYQFLDPAKFDSIAKKAKKAKEAKEARAGRPPAPMKDATESPFNDHLWVPIINCSSFSEGSSKGEFDVDCFTDMLAHLRKRRKGRAPGSLRIRVDGIDKGSLNPTSLSCNLNLGQGASLVKLIAQDNDAEPITFATYVLTYESPKTEYWRVELGEIGCLMVTFEYSEDETVQAHFSIQANAEQETMSKYLSRGKLAELKTILQRIIAKEFPNSVEVFELEADVALKEAFVNRIYGVDQGLVTAFGRSGEDVASDFSKLTGGTISTVRALCKWEKKPNVADTELIRDTWCGQLKDAGIEAEQARRIADDFAEALKRVIEE